MIPLINYTILTDALHALKVGDIRHCESLGALLNKSDFG